MPALRRGHAAGEVHEPVVVLLPEMPTAATGAAPYWSLTCGNPDTAQLARLDQPMAANRTATTTVTVPSTCTGQWLTLSVRPAPDSSPQSGAVAWVSVSAR